MGNNRRVTARRFYMLTRSFTGKNEILRQINISVYWSTYISVGTYSSESWKSMGKHVCKSNQEKWDN